MISNAFKEMKKTFDTKAARERMNNETFKEIQKEFNPNTAQTLYAVLNTDSNFVGVYSSIEKAQSIIKMLGGKYDSKDLIVSYEYIDDPLAR